MEADVDAGPHAGGEASSRAIWRSHGVLARGLSDPPFPPARLRRVNEEGDSVPGSQDSALASWAARLPEISEPRSGIALEAASRSSIASSSSSTPPLGAVRFGRASSAVGLSSSIIGASVSVLGLRV